MGLEASNVQRLAFCAIKLGEFIIRATNDGREHLLVMESTLRGAKRGRKGRGRHSKLVGNGVEAGGIDESIGAKHARNRNPHRKRPSFSSALCSSHTLTS